MIFLVDTSVMTPGRFRPLLEKCAVSDHRVEVPALIYAERLFQLRREQGDKFNPATIRAWFDRFAETLSVQALSPERAENLAENLCGRFADHAAWLAAKRAAWQRCLGREVDEPGAGRPCGGPVDVYIVGLASPERPIVTEDGGPEWRGWPTGTVLRYQNALLRAEQPE